MLGCFWVTCVTVSWQRWLPGVYAVCLCNLTLMIRLCFYTFCTDCTNDIINEPHRLVRLSFFFHIYRVEGTEATKKCLILRPVISLTLLADKSLSLTPYVVFEVYTSLSDYQASAAAHAASRVGRSKRRIPPIRYGSSGELGDKDLAR